MIDLYPRPRHVDALDETVRCAAAVEPVLDESLPAQGYEVHVTADRAVLAHRDEAGRRYGEQTIRQLRAADHTLPAADIRDHPDIATRGVMLDVSRDRVPTRATLQRLVELVATARYNQLQLYVEHTYAYRHHAQVWRDASPITPDDLRWLDQLCAGHGIELVANQNCFGHMGRWLAHRSYRQRAECPDGIEVARGLRLPPGVLAPTASNAEFAIGLVREQMEALTSRTANIGCDETFELGRGASAQRVADVGLATVYGEHLARLVHPLLADGCAVQFWADVLARHPAAADLLPPGDLTPIVWNYDAPDAPAPTVHPRVAAILDEIGIDLHATTDFASRLAELPPTAPAPWVAAGTSSWNSLIGRLDNARANLLDAATTAVAAGVTGLVVTDWGDGGHHHPPSISDPALLYGGALAWCVATNHDLDIPEAVNRHVALDPTGIIGRVLDEIGSLHARTGLVARNVSPLVAALFPQEPHITSGTPDPDAIDGIIAALDRAQQDLTRAQPAAADGGTIVAELDVAIGLARHGARRLAATARSEALDRRVMHDDLSSLCRRYEEVWNLRSRPGGRADSLAHLTRTLDLYRD